ncbi:MAG: regulatory signaling modulator protein AmpE [Pseudomonadota bacterium]
MILIALLVALSIERVVQLPAFWHMDFYLSRWVQWSQEKLHSSSHRSKLEHPLIQLLWLLTPAILAGLLVSWLDHLLVTFICGIIALLISVSCQPARQAYKCYLKAANKGDEEDLEQHKQSLQQLAGHDQETAIEDTVSWLNYQHYVAVIFFYVAFGVFGALAYASIRLADSQYRETFNNLPLSRLRWAIDFIPVRLTGLGLMLVGNFSQALPTWLQSLGDFTSANHRVLAQLTDKAEDLPHHPDDKTDAVTKQLELMKRQQIAWLCVIAVLTIWGGLH